jgi:hypothetical protein
MDLLEQLMGDPEAMSAIGMTEEDAVLLRQAKEMRERQLSVLAIALKTTRDDAVNGRTTSGIEDIWDEDEDAYEGIDNVNRHEVAGPEKPSITGVGSQPGPDEFGSTLLINITRPYVDAAAAKVSDMMLPTDDRPWGVKPTPVPELDEIAQQPLPEEALQQIEAIRARAKAHAEAAEDKIEDWLTECGWHNEMRIVIEDAARIGTGIIKGPYPVKRTLRKVVQGSVQEIVKIEPASKAVNPRNLFPDPSCGTSIHNGSYIWERDWITAKSLRELVGVDGYLEDEIMECLREGPDRRYVEEDRVDGSSLVSDAERYEIWYYHGQLNREDLEAAGADDLPEGMDVVPAVATMVNDRLIKAVVSPLESGCFPYDLVPWQRRQGMPWGTSVGRHVRSPQRMLTASVREMMDNASLTGGPQIIGRKGVVEPANGIWEIAPRKLWWLTEDSMAKAQEAFMAINIPSQQQELLNIIDYALRMAEDSAGLPMLMQGQQGKSPDTVGGMQILNENAHTVLRRLARNLDNLVTEPHIRRYYEWILLYGPEEAQGDFMVDAQGSSALVERGIQNQAIMQLGEFAMNPAFGIDPKKWFTEMLKAQRLDPSRFLYEEGEGPPEIPPDVQQKMQEMEYVIAELQRENQQLELRAMGHEARAQSHVQGKQIDAEARLHTEQMRRQSDAEIEHLRGQYRMELEGLRAQLASVDRQLQGEKVRLDYGKLQLQREALLHQMRQKEADLSKTLNQGALKQVIKNDRYGMIPDAIG